MNHISSFGFCSRLGSCCVVCGVGAASRSGWSSRSRICDAGVLSSESARPCFDSNSKYLSGSISCVCRLKMSIGIVRKCSVILRVLSAR